MAFVSKSFIGNATALDNTETDARGIDSLSKQVEDYLTSINYKEVMRVSSERVYSYR